MRLTVLDMIVRSGAAAVIAGLIALGGAIAAAQTPDRLAAVEDRRRGGRRQAVRLSGFVQRNPDEGAPATEKTDVFIAYDSTDIYYGFHANYADPRIMRASRSDRDQFDQDDTISVYFDPFLDEQRAYVFTVNAYGVQGDSILGGTGGGQGGGGGGIPRGDASWDALFDSAGSLVADGGPPSSPSPGRASATPPRTRATCIAGAFKLPAR